MSVLVIGSSNLDQFCFVDRLPAKGETIIGEKIEYKFGGKGANQAVTLGKLNTDITFLTSVGNDDAGRAMIENFNNVSINTEYIKMSETNPTGTAIITIDNKANNSIVVIQGANNDCDVDYIESHEELFKNHDYLLLQLEIPIESVYKAIDLADKYGVKVILDPAPATNIDEEYYSKIDFITPNETEVELLAFGNLKNRDIRESVDVLLDKGVKNIALTLGSDGAVLFNNNGEIKVDALDMKAVDSVAAGDSFNGGFGSALASGKDVIEAMEYASKVAALTVTKVGAQEAIPTSDEVESFKTNG